MSFLDVIGKIFSNDENDSDYEYSEEYFDAHPEDIPEGCAACGGPYPNCTSSCPLFDD